MELKWNLEELYREPKECYETFEELDRKIKDFQKYAEASLNATNLEEILEDYFGCLSLSYKNLVYGSLCFYKNTKDKACADIKSDVEKKNNETIRALSFIERKILSLGKETIDRFIEENPDLKEYSYFLSNLFRREFHAIEDEETVKLKNEIDELLNRYFDIVKSIEFDPIEENGKMIEITPSNVAKYLMAKKRTTREKTFHSLSKGYEKKKEELAELLNSLYQKRYLLSKKERYKSVLERTLDIENIDQKFLLELQKIVRENVGGLKKYMSIKKKYLDIEDAHLYDLGLPFDVEDRRKYPLSDAVDTLKEAFDPLGGKYWNIISDLLKRGHVDAELDENKSQTMTFSWYGYSFLNYKESYSSLKNLAHELGHSTNDMLSFDLSFPYKISTVFIGETASIVNEMLLNRHLIHRANTPEEKLFYLGKEADNYLTSVFTQMRITELERELYAKVESGEALTSKSISDVYLELLKSYYGDDVAYDEESAYEWTRISHLFRWAFYPFKYASSLLIASATYSNLKDGTLKLEDYISFLSSGSKDTDKNLLKMIHIDLENLEILRKSFSTFYEDLDEIEKLLGQK